MDRDKFGRINTSRSGRGGNDREQHGTPSTSRREENPRSGTWDGNSSTTASSSAGNSTSKWGNTYGLSPTFLESLWITSPLVSKVFVANVS